MRPLAALRGEGISLLCEGKMGGRGRTEQLPLLGGHVGLEYFEMEDPR